MERSLCKLRGYESFLGQCLSLKSIDIRKREAQALQQRIKRELGQKVWHTRWWGR